MHLRCNLHTDNGSPLQAQRQLEYFDRGLVAILNAKAKYLLAGDYFLPILLSVNGGLNQSDRFKQKLKQNKMNNVTK